MKLRHFLQAFIFLFFTILSTTTFAHSPTQHPCVLPCTQSYLDPVQEKALREEFIPLPYIGIAFYKPTYVLPFYYTGSPYNAIYTNQTPSNEHIKSTEFKYQLSLKVPVWKNMFGYPTTFYFGYTQLTYWQLYLKRPFIRETDYEPDFFISNRFNHCIVGPWKLDFLNIGYSHQSNGYGDSLERAWDRIYVQAVTTIDNVMLSLRPWYIIHRNSHNTDIGSYLGYANFILAYKCQQHVLSFEITNIGAAPRRTSANLTWSFPLTPYLKGYAQIFSGYGQSLIEYNHRTNSAGIGLALSDWL